MLELMARLLAALLLGCFCTVAAAGLDAGGADRVVTGSSAYPVASNPDKVGRFPAQVKSGAGYFYDEVLEYRVWLHPHDGARKLNGNDVYYRAFAQYERALEFSRGAKGSEEPLVLIRQLKYVNEPRPGVFEVIEEERIAEWRVQWLAASRRLPGSIEKFMKERQK
jgi:hypothetical protein